MENARSEIQMDLCGICEVSLRKDGREVHLGFSGKDRKITCAVCGRRRYGATYLVSKEIQK